MSRRSAVKKACRTRARLAAGTAFCYCSVWWGEARDEPARAFAATKPLRRRRRENARPPGKANCATTESPGDFKRLPGQWL